MKRFYETALLLIGTLGWWGFVYPELSAVTETCVQENIQENVGAELGEEIQEEGTQVQKLGTAQEIHFFVEKLIRELGEDGFLSGDVRIKSRIAEYLYQEKEKGTTEKESGYEEQECAHRGV